MAAACRAPLSPESAAAADVPAPTFESMLSKPIAVQLCMQLGREGELQFSQNETRRRESVLHLRLAAPLPAGAASSTALGLAQRPVWSADSSQYQSSAGRRQVRIWQISSGHQVGGDPTSEVDKSCGRTVTVVPNEIFSRFIRSAGAT